MRIVVIVLDGCGVGAAPDAARYKDEGTDTMKHCARAAGGLKLPNLERLGLGHIGDFPGVGKSPHTLASFGKMQEASAGKDTITGHWEIAGLVRDNPFPTYPRGFPPEVIESFLRAVGKTGVLGNKPASGTQIIQELGEEHLRSGLPIVYTSADSVFQIAAHEKITPLAELHRMCAAARRVLTGAHRVGRVIARPFGGARGDFQRVPGRKDFTVAPPEATLLDKLRAGGYVTAGIGKIGDIFAHTGLDEVIHTDSNQEGIDRTIEALDGYGPDFIFTNLVDFDTLYGHRNDAEGFARALRYLDSRLPEIIEALAPEDTLILTADHGCDPTGPGTDHTREFVPLLVFGAMIAGGVNLGTRTSFADLGQTIAQAFRIEKLPHGTSFWPEVSKEHQGVSPLN